jgi:hypothetical protein
VGSQVKIVASRANGRKSRGPRTPAGKSNASRNAFRHGLAAITRKDPEIFAEIEPVARAICNGAVNPLLFEQALIIAENDFVLRCAQTEWIAATERQRDRMATPLATGDLGFARAKARIERAKLIYQTLVESTNKDAASNNAARNNAASTSAASTDEAHVRSNRERERAVAEQGGRVTPPLEREEFDAMRAAMADLKRLERYRRRAWSRQRRAFQRFMEIQSAAFRNRPRRMLQSGDQAHVHENQGVLDGSS